MRFSAHRFLSCLKWPTPLLQLCGQCYRSAAGTVRFGAQQHYPAVIFTEYANTPVILKCLRLVLF